MTPVRLEPAASRSGVKHSTTEPLGSLVKEGHDRTETMVCYRYCPGCKNDDREIVKTWEKLAADNFCKQLESRSGPTESRS